MKVMIQNKYTQLIKITKYLNVSVHGSIWLSLIKQLMVWCIPPFLTDLEGKVDRATGLDHLWNCLYKIPVGLLAFPVMWSDKVRLLLRGLFRAACLQLVIEISV